MIEFSSHERQDKLYERLTQSGATNSLTNYVEYCLTMDDILTEFEKMMRLPVMKDTIYRQNFENDYEFFTNLRNAIQSSRKQAEAQLPAETVKGLSSHSEIVNYGSTKSINSSSVIQ